MYHQSSGGSTLGQRFGRLTKNFSPRGQDHQLMLRTELQRFMDITLQTALDDLGSRVVSELQELAVHSPSDEGIDKAKIRLRKDHDIRTTHFSEDAADGMNSWTACMSEASAPSIIARERARDHRSTNGTSHRLTKLNRDTSLSGSFGSVKSSQKRKSISPLRRPGSRQSVAAGAQGSLSIGGVEWHSRPPNMRSSLLVGNPTSYTALRRSLEYDEHSLPQGVNQAGLAVESEITSEITALEGESLLREGVFGSYEIDVDEYMEEQHQCSLTAGVSSWGDGINQSEDIRDNWSWANACVTNAHFEHSVGLMILVNAALLGLETDYHASGDTEHWLGLCLASSEIFFAVAFSLELALRMFTFGLREFFLGDCWQWNVFDCVIVGLQVLEQSVHLLIASNMTLNTTFLRLLRILRLIRITRLVRVVRYVEELQTIVASILASLMSLFWTLLLLLMVIYITSVFFTQVVHDVQEELTVGTDDDKLQADRLEIWYGRLIRTILTMFEIIVGGVSWDECIRPLLKASSPFMGIVLCLYIAFCVFAIMNMATGVFLERATRKAQEDKDTNTANHISDLFLNDPLVNANAVTWEVFAKKLDSPEMKEYFRAINVDPSEARGLFQLLDIDDSGELTGEELVNGCLRLRGGAKALELSLLMHETSRMHMSMVSEQAKMGETLEFILSTMRPKGRESEESKSAKSV